MPDLPGLKRIICAALVTTMLSGCSSLSSDPTGTLADVAASDRDLPLRPLVPEARPIPGKLGVPGYAEKLAMSDAVRRTLTFNPAIRAAFLEIEARRGEEVQSAVKPNPEMLLEVENFAGDKDKASADVTESTLSFAQTIELGDKRLKRLQAAHLDSSLATWDHETVRLRAASATAQAFVEVLIAQQRIEVLGEFVTIAEKTRDSVDARVKGGKASPIEADRAVVALARAKALQKVERARLEGAKRKLSSLWGAPDIDFGRALGRLGKAPVVPGIVRLRNYLTENPSLARWSDEVNRRVAQLNLERAKAIPDIKVGAGVRHFNENDSTAMVASLAVPLPLFDRNQGNIAAAGRRIEKAENDALATRNELYGALVDAHGELNAAATQLAAMEQDVLPAAQRAFDRTKIGFDEGKFDILNVLDVQRSVFETRLEVLTARSDFEKARVRLEAVIGRDLTGIDD